MIDVVDCNAWTLGISCSRLAAMSSNNTAIAVVVAASFRLVTQPTIPGRRSVVHRDRCSASSSPTPRLGFRTVPLATRQDGLDERARTRRVGRRLGHDRGGDAPAWQSDGTSPVRSHRRVPPWRRALVATGSDARPERRRSPLSRHSKSCRQSRHLVLRSAPSRRRGPGGGHHRRRHVGMSLVELELGDRSQRRREPKRRDRRAVLTSRAFCVTQPHRGAVCRDDGADLLDNISSVC